MVNFVFVKINVRTGRKKAIMNFEVDLSKIKWIIKKIFFFNPFPEIRGQIRKLKFAKQRWFSEIKDANLANNQDIQ